MRDSTRHDRNRGTMAKDGLTETPLKRDATESKVKRQYQVSGFGSSLRDYLRLGSVNSTVEYSELESRLINQLTHMDILHIRKNSFAQSGRNQYSSPNNINLSSHVIRYITVYIHHSLLTLLRASLIIFRVWNGTISGPSKRKLAVSKFINANPVLPTFR